ncbi:MAG: urea transporter, partial [Thaumarchaeota archaeon]|nr:urea transporter [Nitrososphaerota archaeon]
MGIHKLPALTAPFVLTAWVFLFAARTLFKGISPSVGWWERWPTYGAEDKMEVGEFIKAVFRGNAQVMFSDSWITGVIFFVGYTLGGIRYYWAYGPEFGLEPLTTGTGGPFLLGGVIGFVGSLCGTLMALACGADKQSIKHGLYGFNGSLCAHALAAGALPGFGLFPMMTPASILFGAIVAAAISSIVMAFVTEMWKPYSCLLYTSDAD